MSTSGRLRRQFLADFSSTLFRLRTSSVQPVLQTRRFTPILGLCLAAQSVMDVSAMLLNEQGFQYACHTRCRKITCSCCSAESTAWAGTITTRTWCSCSTPCAASRCTTSSVRRLPETASDQFGIEDSVQCFGALYDRTQSRTITGPARPRVRTTCRRVSCCGLGWSRLWRGTCVSVFMPMAKTSLCLACSVPTIGTVCTSKCFSHTSRLRSVWTSEAPSSGFCWMNGTYVIPLLYHIAIDPYFVTLVV